MTDEQVQIECVICDSNISKVWWKCCPQHTTESGKDAVCESCYHRLHPENESLEKKKSFVCYFGADYQKPIAKIEILDEEFFNLLHNYDAPPLILSSAIDESHGELKYLVISPEPAVAGSANPYKVPNRFITKSANPYVVDV